MALDANVQKSLDDTNANYAALNTKVDKAIESIAEVSKSLASPNYGGRDKIFAEVKDPKEEGRYGFRNLGEQLKHIQIACKSGLHTVDKRLEAVNAINKGIQGQSESIGSDGGFLLAPTFVSKIYEIMHEQQNLLDMVDKHDISGPSVVINANDETSRATGSRFGGVQSYWVGEGDSITKSKPKWRQIRMSPHKLASVYYTTDELLADGGQMLSTAASRYCAEDMVFMTNDAIINGTGVDKPMGILTSASCISVSAEAGQATKTVLSQNIIKMWARLHASSRSRSEWWMNQEVEAQIPQMTLGTAGAQLLTYMPPGGLSGKPYATMLGRPIRVLEQCPGLGTQGDIMLVDPKQYLACTRGTIQSAMSIHVEFLTDQTAFRFTFRVDGQPWWTKALTPYKGTNTQSPFISLASR